MKPIKTWIIVNPISGGYDKRKVIDLILRKLPSIDFEVTLFKTEHKGHGAQVAKDAIKEKVNLIIAIGGDGTFHEVGTVLIHSKIALALIPMGSGNGLARHLKIPLKFEQSIERILKGKPQEIDTFSLNDNICLNAAGIGFDGYAAYLFDQAATRGLKTYILSVIKAYLNFNPFTSSIDNKVQKSTLFVAIMNGTQYGNNFILNANQCIDSGFVQHITIKKGNIFQSIQFALLAFHGYAHYSSLYSSVNTSDIYFTTDNEFAHLDGEPLVLSKKKHHLKVVPKSLIIWL